MRSPSWGRPKIYDAQFTSLGPKRCWCLMLNVIFHGMLPLRHDHKNGVNSLNHHTPKMCLWDYSHPQIVRRKKNNIPTNLMAIYLSIYIWGLLCRMMFGNLSCPRRRSRLEALLDTAEAETMQGSLGPFSETGLFSVTTSK